VRVVEKVSQNAEHFAILSGICSITEVIEQFYLKIVSPFKILYYYITVSANMQAFFLNIFKSRGPNKTRRRTSAGTDPCKPAEPVCLEFCGLFLVWRAVLIPQNSPNLFP
ncbi:MAG: hypothetical protein LBU18_05555, partial [Treponema sp.]|nr:hypothetical protein [Treponema sp.]